MENHACTNLHVPFTSKTVGQREMATVMQDSVLHFSSAVVHSWLDFLLSKLWLELKKLMDGEYNLCMLTFPFLFILLLNDYYVKYKT